jgi:hypothetical protein
MATQNLPMVTNEIVGLVETMRSAQLAYDAMIENRESNATQHQLRRANQMRKDAERKVDAWLEQYKKDVRAWYKFQGDYETNELPGLYKTE